VRRLSASETRAETEAAHPPRPRGFELAEITEVNLLSPEDFHPAMNRIVFRLPEGLTYEMGDQIQVLPRNDPTEVAHVLDALGFPPDTPFTIDGDELIPGRLTLSQLFVQFLDLAGLPTRALIAAFHGAADAEGRALLAPLIDPADEWPFKAHLADTSVAETLCQFARYGVPPLDTLIPAIPRMQPRFYAISCTPEANPGHLDILVLEVLFGKDNKRRGLTTHFLISPLAKFVPLKTRKGAFRYPPDPESPIIMCALGSGLSPMLALLQHRQAIAPRIGPAILFVGTRFRDNFPLLFRKLGKFQQEGLLNEVYHAVSREGPKVYVQDLMKQNTERLWDLWQDHRTHFYYCGPKRGVPKDLKEIMLEITVTEGWLSREEAMAFNNRHEWIIEEG
jgi:sulfite reductase alpha subunit-like flavoprotein